MINLFFIALLGSTPSLIIRFFIARKPFGGFAAFAVSLIIAVILFTVFQLSGVEENLSKTATGLIGAWSFLVLHFFNFEKSDDQSDNN